MDLNKQRFPFWAAVLSGIVAVSAAQAGEIGPQLEAELDSAAPGETVTAIFYLNEQVDIAQMQSTLRAAKASRKARHEAVVRALQDTAKGQDAFFAAVDKAATAKSVARVRSYWIVNSVLVEAAPAVIRELASHPDIAEVLSNNTFALIEPTATAAAPANLRDTITPGVEAIHAPLVWELDGIDGAGILVATIDTGVDGDHPALESRWAGVLPEYAGHPEWAWMWRGSGTHDDVPVDADHYHGTHTMGTICGGAPGNQIGVAPGAHWISAGVPNFQAEYIAEAFEWLIDPDGDPSTTWDVPRVCSNSWGADYKYGCVERWWEAIEACETAGILMLFSAGNSGEAGAGTLGSPGSFAADEYRVCAVGAVDATNYTTHWPRADFSSMGPSVCTLDGSVATKPDLSAPGVDVLSATPGGDYILLSGTSMATPHVAGVCALMLQANPDLFIEDAKQILYDTATDLGEHGKDNQYGWGVIDAYYAVHAALDQLDPAPPRVQDKTWRIYPNETGTLDMPVWDYDGSPNPMSVEVLSLPDAGALIDAGTDHTILASELPYTLNSNGVTVRFEPAPDFFGTTTFTFQATDGGEAPHGGYSDIATITAAVLFRPPSITNDPRLPDAEAGKPYPPLQIASDAGQPDLVWTFDPLETGWGIRDSILDSCLYEPVGEPMGWQGDEEVWAYYFPEGFEFPFDGASLIGTYVAANGYLSFDSSESDPYNEVDKLLSTHIIAPYWADLRTDLGGDIYVDTSVSGQVTFRWVGERWHYGDPVEFSCTLFADGRIRFDYGPGNANAAPTVGCFRQRSSYEGAASLAYANSIEYSPVQSLPRGMSLSSDGVLSGTPDPRDVGPWPVPVKLTDALGRTDTLRLLLWVAPAGGTAVGDLDGDGDVDLDDFAAFAGCLGGPTVTPDAACGPADWDGDADIDLADFAVMQRAFMGE